MTPLNLMSVEELSYVLDRMQRMLRWFAAHAEGGNFERACAIYEAVGSLVRRIVEQETGHAPEQFPVQGVIITGKANEVPRLKLAPYRAALFPMDEGQETEG
jgi:hypothetical protein